LGHLFIEEQLGLSEEVGLHKYFAQRGRNGRRQVNALLMQAESKFQDLVHLHRDFGGECGQYADESFFSDGLNLVQANHALSRQALLRTQKDGTHLSRRRRHMKAKPEVLEVLQENLKEELGAIHQYFLHSEICENWGYERLSEHIRKISFNEMVHAEEIIERMLFLEGMPNLSELPKLNIGKDVKQMLENDLALEHGAVNSYNEGIATCRKVGDNGTADFLKKILTVEEGHVDFFEEQLGLIEQVGVQNYLAQQLGEDSEK
jgi:bacterioferritin